MKKLLHVIHIEDSADDSELIHRHLSKEGIDCEINRVETKDQLLKALAGSKCDLILSDCALPNFHGLKALEMTRTTNPEIPFIFVSGTIGEETAIETLQNGASDYVLKQRLSRLTPAVRRAMNEAAVRTARGGMEAQLEQARKLETVGTMAAGLTHDFRNLLQILKMGIGLLPIHANNPEQILKISEQLEKATDRGSRMMQELLAFAGKADVQLVPVDLPAQVRQISQIMQPDLPSNIKLVLNLKESLPPILADVDQLDRILSNVILNARDAMPQGGTITLDADMIRFNSLPAQAWQTTDTPYLRVVISDAGIGMDEAMLSRIFDPFFTTKAGGKGTGLGLSVVFGLMEVHRGFIDLQSQKGEGTTFSIFFPLAPGGKVAPEQVRTISPVRLIGRPSQAEPLLA